MEWRGGGGELRMEGLTSRGVHGPAVTDHEHVLVQGLGQREEHRLDLHHRPEELLLELQGWRGTSKLKISRYPAYST
jgi:hypothetical protein